VPHSVLVLLTPRQVSYLFGPGDVTVGEEAFGPGGVSSEDLRRVELAIALWELHAVCVPDEDAEAWQTLGDIVRSVVAHAERQPWELPLTEAEMWPKVQKLVADGWYIRPEELTPETPLFSGPLRLDDCGPFQW
jgi:acyl carrier protein